MRPVTSRSASAAFFALLFAATLAGNWNGASELVGRAVKDSEGWNGRGYRANGENTDAFRQLAESHLSPGESLYYCTNSRDGRLSPAERSTHLALSWALSPVPVEFGIPDETCEASAIIVSRFLDSDFPGYWLAAGNESAVLWRRAEAATEPQGTMRRPLPPGVLGELFGVVAVCAAIAVFVWRMRRRDAETGGGLPGSGSPPLMNSAVSVSGVVMFFCLASFLALSHTFMAPTGLGVYGGKAKLFLLSRGIPDGFFADPAFSSYQPAYPPGLALLTLGAYLVGGGCGEWLTQLIPVFAATVALWLVTRSAAESRWAMLWVMAAFLGRQALQTVTFFYAEPFVALFSILAWMRLREDRQDMPGWVLLGATGLFKAEGVVLLLAVWVAFCIHATLSSEDVRRVRRVIGWRSSFFWMKQLAAAFAPPVSWYVASRIAGACFYDYAPFWRPDPARFCEAACYLLKTAFLEPWRYGFAYPIAVVVAVLAFVRRPAVGEGGCSSPLSVSSFVALICLALFAFIYSLSLAPDFGWHLWSSAARLLWVPSLFVLVECAAVPSLHFGDWRSVR